MASAPPTDPKLKPLYKETTFWLLLAISLPGLIALFASAIHDLLEGRSPDTGSLEAGVFATPIVLYLGIFRPQVRGKSVEAYGLINAGQGSGLPVISGGESNPPMGYHPDGEQAIVDPDGTVVSAPSPLLAVPASLTPETGE